MKSGAHATAGTGTLPRLALTGIDKSFAGVHALRGVSFELAAGEVHALVGENGAGKSTLIKIVTGVHAPDAGVMAVDGRVLSGVTPALARESGITAIYQHPELFPDLTVAENLAIAFEPSSPWRRVDRHGRRIRARALLDDLGASIDPDRLAGTLSMPEQQLVEIAKAVGADARIVLMDEPTSSLTDRETRHLIEIVRRLATRGVGVIYISHRLPEVFAVADRLTVLRDGAVVTTRDRADVSPDEVIKMMVGRAVTVAARAGASTEGEVVLAVRHLSARDGTVEDVSFEVRRGEVLGIAGLMGAGRTELAEIITGLRKRASGGVAIDRVPIRVESPRDAIAAGVAYVPEDRLQHGVIADMSVAENTTLASLASVSRGGLIDRSREVARANEYVRRFAIKTTDVDTPVGMLSGGNQQKVALARGLAAEPKVLIADEPTQGVDVASKAEIHAHLRSLAADGLAVVMISSDLSEVLAMSDRVLVMREGTVAGELARGQATEETILALALPDRSRDGRPEP